MKEIYFLIFSALFSGLIAILGYFVKSVHTEVKALLKELTEYTQELRNLISGIQVQIDKGIESDITEIKEDVKNLYRKTNTHTTELSKLKNNLS
jgi:predicted PurR-regulated permease PerM